MLRPLLALALLVELLELLVELVELLRVPLTELELLLELLPPQAENSIISARISARILRCFLSIASFVSFAFFS